MGRVGTLPSALAKVHPVFETPSTAAILELVFTLVIGLLFGWLMGPMNGYVLLATIMTITMIAIYLLANVSAIVYFAREGRDEFSVWKHVIVPILGLAFFLPPIVVSVYPAPAYPANYAAPFILVWIVIGTITYTVLRAHSPQTLVRAGDVFVAAD